MIFCQRCKKPNPETVEYCESCGARLMLVTPSFEREMFEHQEGAFEEHLLERISTLEGALARANERIEQMLELAHQQATGSFYDHMMLEALAETLAEAGTLDSDDLEQRWKRRVARHHAETAERERLDERCDLIINAYRGTQREEREHFIDLIEEGTLLMSEGRARRGLRLLLKALALDENNTELSFTIGEYYFHQGKGAEAMPYLHRALAKDQLKFGAALLLGLIDGQAGQAESAKEHLHNALALDESSFAAHYGLGQLFFGERKFDEALLHLKRALALKPSPEMHYLVGRAHWEQGEGEAALRHLKKAVRLDPEFDAALYSLGFLYWQTQRPVKAREYLLAAYAINPRDVNYQAAVAAAAGEGLPAPHALGWRNLFESARPATRHALGRYGRRAENAAATRKQAPRPDDARLHDLLWGDLQTTSLAPRKTPRK